MSIYVVLFVGVFGVYRPTRECFTHIETSTFHTGEGLQILTYARHSFPLRSEVSLTCHINCDKGLQFILVTHTCCRLFGSGAVTTCFYDLGLSGLELEHPTFRMRSERFINRMRHCGGQNIVEDTKEKT